MDNTTLALFQKLEDRIRDVDVRQGGPRGPKGRKGDRGADGTNGTSGPQGSAGQDGKKGKDGATGPRGPSGNLGAPGSRGPIGPSGTAGLHGLHGSDGRDGLYITDADIDPDGYLTLYMSDGSEIEAGKVALDEALQQIVYTSSGGLPDVWKDKVDKVIEDLKDHIADKGNPHEVAHDQLIDSTTSGETWVNKHHPQLHDFNSHTDVELLNLKEGQGIWQDALGVWRNRAAFEESWPTGLASGGELNIGPGANDIEVIAGLGVLVDSYTNPVSPPTVIALQWPLIHEPITAAPSVAGSIVWFSIYDTGLASTPIGGIATNVGALRQYAQGPNPTLSRQEIFLGFAIHDGASWQEVSSPKVLNQAAETLREVVTAVLPFTHIISGGIITEEPLFTLAQAEGVLWENNRNWHVDKSDPNREILPASNPMSFQYVNRDFTIVGAPTSTIAPTNWDNAGVIEAVPGPANTTTIQRVYLDPADNYWILYGQVTYPNFLTAQANLFSDVPVIPFLLQNSLLLGFVIAEKSKNDWDVDEAIFVSAGASTGSGGGGTPITDHNNLNGIGPDDHHPQEHLLGSHTDVDTTVPVEIRHGLFWNGLKFAADYRTRWINGGYVGGATYEKSDQILDSGYLAVANQQTTERPSPQPTGAPSYGPTDGAVWSQNNNNTGSVVVRTKYVTSQDLMANKVFVIIADDSVGLLHTISAAINGIVQNSVTFTPEAAGRREVAISTRLVPAGSTVNLRLEAVNPASPNRVGWVTSANYWNGYSSPEIASAQGNIDGGAYGTTAYGIDFIVIPADISEHWDIQNAPDGVSSGGGDFTPTTFTGAGTTGYVPDPTTEVDAFLRDDGTWVVPTDNDTTDHLLLTNIGTNTHVQLDSHLASTANPHNTTYANIGGTQPAPIAHTHLGNDIVGGVVDGGTY